MSKEVNIIARMSVKGVGAKPEGTPEPKRLCVFYGVADGTKTGEDSNGRMWTAVTGNFEGVNIETGEVFRSGKLFLPDGIQQVLESAMKNSENGSVKFGMELRSVKASNPIGYAYQGIPLVKPIAEDPLTELRNELTGTTGIKQIEAAATVVDTPATATLPASAKKGK